MLSSNLVPSFYYSNFIAAVSGPYTNLNAYRSGVIDANGNILKPESSIDAFEYLVIKLKKIFEQLPPGTTRAKLNQYGAAFQLFSEEASSFGMDIDTVKMIIEGFVLSSSSGKLSYMELLEDMTSGNLGGPASSPAANTGAITGFDKPMGQPLTRKLASVLGFEKEACQMYDVCPEDFDELSNPNLKNWEEVPDSETKRYMQRAQRRGGGSLIIIRDSGTNRMHKLNLKPRNLSKLMSEQKELNPDNFDTADAGTKADTAEVVAGNQQTQEIQSSGKSTRKQRKLAVYDAIRRTFESEHKRSDGTVGRFTFNPTTNPAELKLGEFGIFEPGHGKKSPDPILDIQIRHDLGGEPVTSSIEAKYNQMSPTTGTTDTFDWVVRRGETTKVPKLGGGFVDVSVEGILRKHGAFSQNAEMKNKRLRKYFSKAAERVQRKISEFLGKKGGMTFIGNHQYVSIIHNTHGDDPMRKHHQALLDAFNLHASHEPSDISRGGSPYIAFEKAQKSQDVPSSAGVKHMKIRMTAHGNVQPDTKQKIQHNASIFGISAFPPRKGR